ncbi:HalOD1 output domain-containing protein [Halobellus salinisoli]|uniref:HalOD1 output domain-containing protein n=1 Tax=Halobellus salinisoli TaxID=3108500 RepID=UPI00300BBB7A
MHLLDNSPPNITQNRCVAEEEPSTAVGLAVAEVTDTDALELPPLYEVLDPDALNQLFADEPRSNRSGEAQITFPFEDCWIAVWLDDGITVVPQEELNVSPAPSQREVYQAKHEWTAVSSFSITLLQALKEFSQQRDLTYPVPLTKIIDLDSLDRLFAPIDEQSRRDAGWLSFSVDGFRITVEASGQIKFDHASRPSSERGNNGW